MGMTRGRPRFLAAFSRRLDDRIRLDRKDGHVTFEIEDDGGGFDTRTTGYDTGLRGMEDRLDAIGGSLEVRSTPGRGTTIAGRVPVTARRGTP
jgi:signal transduction histidine kinase